MYHFNILIRSYHFSDPNLQRLPILLRVKAKNSYTDLTGLYSLSLLTSVSDCLHLSHIVPASLDILVLLKQSRNTLFSMSLNCDTLCLEYFSQIPEGYIPPSINFLLKYHPQDKVYATQSAKLYLSYPDSWHF